MNSSWKVYFTEQNVALKQEHVAQNKVSTSPERMKLLAEKWKTLTAEERKVYETKASENSATDKLAKSEWEKKRLRKPMNAFFLYCKAAKPQLLVEQPGLSVTQIASVLATRYKVLSAEEKSVYTKLFDVAKAEYLVKAANITPVEKPKKQKAATKTAKKTAAPAKKVAKAD